MRRVKGGGKSSQFIEFLQGTDHKRFKTSQEEETISSRRGGNAQGMLTAYGRHISTRP